MDEQVKSVDIDHEDTRRGKFMTFQSGNEYYGIGIDFVNEIISMQKFTEVPEVPEYIKGLINLRGKIIPVIDVRIRFKKTELEYNDRTCIIVIDVKGIVLGLIVDTIAEVVTIEEENIVPPPHIGNMLEANQYVYGIGKIGEDVKLLLDCEKLINDNDEELLKDIVD